MTREDFEKKLRQIFDYRYWHPTVTCVDALIRNDVEALSEINDCISSCESKINNYLTLYDAASNDQERLDVIGSVVKKLG